MDDVLRPVDLDHGPGLVDCSQPAAGNSPQQACTRLVQWPAPVAAKQCLSIPAQFGSGMSFLIDDRLRHGGALIDRGLGYRGVGLGRQ